MANNSKYQAKYNKKRDTTHIRIKKKTKKILDKLKEIGKDVKDLDQVINSLLKEK